MTLKRIFIQKLFYTFISYYYLRYFFVYDEIPIKNIAAPNKLQFFSYNNNPILALIDEF